MSELRTVTIVIDAAYAAVLISLLLTVLGVQAFLFVQWVRQGERLARVEATMARDDKLQVIAKQLSALLEKMDQREDHADR